MHLSKSVKFYSTKWTIVYANLISYLRVWEIPGRSTEYDENIIALQMYKTISLKGMGLKGTDQGTLDMSGASKTKVKRIAHAHWTLVNKLLPTEVQINSDATIHV